MKRLLVLLLLLIFPVCALSEAYEVTLKVETDDEIFPSCVKEFLQKISDLSAEDANKYVQLLHALLRDSAVTAIVQEDAVSMEVELAGGSLFDMIVRESETASYLTTTLLPGYVLMEEKEPTADLLHIVQDLLDESVVQSATDSIEIALSNWLSDIEPTVTRGLFQGDAYQGGTQCTTWIVTDQDIAACLSSVATDEVRELLSQILTASRIDAADLFAQFDAINDRVADEDKYIYILRVVKDDTDRFVGLSLTVMADVSQLATLSLGLTDKEVRLVVGLGLDSQNYWWEYVVQTNQRDHMSFLKGVSREWISGKADAFAYVSATNAPVSAYTWSCNIVKSGQRYLWDGSVYTGDTVDAAKVICSYSGSVNSVTSTFEALVSFVEASRTPLKVEFSYKPVDTIQPLDNTLIVCSASDPAQEELYGKLNLKLSFEISARLLKLLPMDVILTLSDIFMGH